MRTRWKALLGVGASGLAFVVYEAVRIGGYRSHGAGLIAVASRFPRSYTVGRGPAGFYVSLGDSTAAGLGCSRVEETLPYLVASGFGNHCAVTNLAVSGARLEDVVREQLPRFPKRPHALVTVSISANDATRGTDASAFESELDDLMRLLRKRKVTRVVLTTTPNFFTTPALPYGANRLLARRAEALSAIVERVAARYPFVGVADLNRRGTLAADQYAADGFHPSPEGYRRWAAILLASALER